MHLSGQRPSGVVAPILVKRGLASSKAEPEDNRRCQGIQGIQGIPFKARKEKITIILEKAYRGKLTRLR
jgi:hypothetical protein